MNHQIIIPGENLVGEAAAMITAGAEQLHIYCPKCGDVWLHAITNHDFPRHHFTATRCRKCGNGALYRHFNPFNMSHNLVMREVLLQSGDLLANNGLKEN